jgi:hypothetical protein
MKPTKRNLEEFMACPYQNLDTLYDIPIPMAKD